MHKAKIITLTGEVMKNKFSLIFLLLISLTAFSQLEKDEHGWTIIEPEHDSRVIYISSSEGNDSNDGLSPQSAKATIQAAKYQLRHGYPDHLLLKKGDTFENQSIGGIKTSGRSAEEPLVFSTYGNSNERPLVIVPLGSNAFLTTGGGGAPQTIDNWVVNGIHFRTQDEDTDRGAGAYLIRGGSNILIEDCVFERFHNGLTVQGADGAFHNFKLRRSIIIENHPLPGKGHSQGIYTSNVHGALIEENVFDTNGWHPEINGAIPTIFNHNMYLNNGSSDFKVIGNIVANASSHGMQLRCGGIVEDNLFVKNSINMLFGGSNPVDGENTGEARRNVILEGKNIADNLPRGWGLNAEGLIDFIWEDNIIAHQGTGNMPVALTFSGWPEGGASMSVRNNIVYNWKGSITIDTDNISSFNFENNDIQNSTNSDILINVNNFQQNSSFVSAGNSFHSNSNGQNWFRINNNSNSVDGWKSYFADNTSSANDKNYDDPDRNLAGYNATLGGEATYEAFMAEARKQSRDNWRTEYTANAVNEYIREGFSLNVSGFNDEKSKSAELISNYPNPFNPVTNINYTVGTESISAQNINLSIYNAKGQIVKTLVNNRLKPGKYSVKFNASNLNSGIYYYKLTTSEKTIVNRMIFLK